MNVSFRELKGMNKELHAKLQTHGVKSAQNFLAASRTPKGRQELAAKTGHSPKHILELANRADLARVKGVGRIYADLLEEAGIDTVKELANRVPANLHEKLVEVNNAKQFARRAPRASDVKAWIAQAKKMPKKLEY